LKLEYWYDHSTSCWWAAQFDEGGNQIGDAVDSYDKTGIMHALDTWEDQRPTCYECGDPLVHNQHADGVCATCHDAINLDPYRVAL